MKPKKQIPRLYVLNDPTVLRIVPALANKIGLNESIMLMQIDHLKSISNTENKKGRPWTYQSIRSLRQEYFPFWSTATINRVIESLQSQRLIRCDNFNKAAYDKTRWISLNYGKIGRLGCLLIGGGLSQNETRSTQNETRSTQNETTIPEIPTETSTNESVNILPKLKEPKKSKNVSRETIENYPELEKVYMVLNNYNIEKTKLSDNTKRMIANTVKKHGLSFCLNGIEGRILQMKQRGQKDLYLPTLFDPERIEWLDSCAKLWLEHKAKIINHPAISPEMDKLMDEMQAQWIAK